MLKKFATILKIAPTAAFMALACTALPAAADDTEIYQADLSASASTSRPKVLIVLDDSGSMNTIVTGQRPDYDPNATYDVKFPAGRVYWSTSGGTPNVGHSRWFPATENRCASSYTGLSTGGVANITDAKRWIDSVVVPGLCTNVCPSGQTYRNGSNGRACYEQVTPTVAVEKLVYVRGTNWRGRCTGGLIRIQRRDTGDTDCYREEASAAPLTGWVYRGPDGSGNSCPIGQTNLRIRIPGPDPDNCYEEVTAPEFVPGPPQWQYRGPSTLDCDPSTVQPGRWAALDPSDHSPTHVECANDVAGNNVGNGPGQANGYPQDIQENGNEYGPAIDPTIAWTNSPHTFYTSHYLNWWHDDSLIQDKTRMKIAQDVITDIIDQNKDVDFGLVEFNYLQGGRIAHRIIENMSQAQRDNLINMVDITDHSGATPMCEAMYEAYRYISGQGVVFGNDAQAGTDSRGIRDVLPKDPLAEVPGGGTYISPNTDCAFTYIILITDGEPSWDADANAAIKTLTSTADCGDYRNASGGMTENCLAVLTNYMATNDLDPALPGEEENGDQFAITYTIGFATEQPLLIEAAGGAVGASVADTPRAFSANNAQELTDAFQGAIVSILTEATTFTSPAVAVDTFTRTQSRNEVFYAMFEPSAKIDWIGNIKKLKLNGDTDLVDANTDLALEEATGKIKQTAVTFWDNVADGPNVNQGGVGALLAARDPATRSIHTNTGSGGALEAFNSTNIDASAMGLPNNTALYNLFGAADQAGFEKQLAWAQGYDAFSPTPSATREWILGDILHSQPLVINYGARGSFTNANPDLRLLVGSNSGFVHMFGNDNGQEDWAFFPKELAEILPLRRLNARSSNHVYGMDLTPVTYTKDVNGDGTLDSGNGDKAWAFLGMRRGGKGYYALDVSNPDAPSFLWKIDKNTSGFGELGQSWSTPVVTKIPGYSNPVLIFGAGYDLGKDTPGVGAADGEGRGLFIVDAETGALVWSVTPASNSATNLSEAGLLHSVPASVTILDSNRDLMADRIYFGDTGGNVWRVDLSGETLPTSAQNTWSIVKLGDFNTGLTATDRRFFNAPDIVRLRLESGRAADAVIIGSGDQTNPNATDVNNRLYVIRDLATSTYETVEPTSAQCAASPRLAQYKNDFRCELPLSDGNLYDVTDNDLVNGTTAEKAAANLALNAANGWLFEFPGNGEKNLARTLTINGTIYVPTFTPADALNTINVCAPESGSGQLYVFDLYNGDRSTIDLGPIIPDTPSLHFAEDGTISILIPPGAKPTSVGGPNEVICAAGVCDPDETLRRPYGNYWFQEAY